MVINCYRRYFRYDISIALPIDIALDAIHNTLADFKFLLEFWVLSEKVFVIDHATEVTIESNDLNNYISGKCIFERLSICFKTQVFRSK